MWALTKIESWHNIANGTTRGVLVNGLPMVNLPFVLLYKKDDGGRAITTSVVQSVQEIEKEKKYMFQTLNSTYELVKDSENEQI